MYFLYCGMKYLGFFCLFLCLHSSYGQAKNQFYALDAQMNQTVLDSSKYILWIHQKADSNWQWDYYNTWGPLIKSDSFEDFEGKVPNGKFYRYKNTGILDSTGSFDHGMKNGSFYKLNSLPTGRIVNSRKYDYLQDSLVKIIHTDSSGFGENNGDTLGLKEPEYLTGQMGWLNYLKDNFAYPNRAAQKNIHGQVQLLFEVEENGAIDNICIWKSVEYSLDQESVKVLINSGKWLPGIKNGLPVKTYKLQRFEY